MAKIVSFLGEKGGSGKSSLSHLLAHGLGSLPRSIDAVVVSTDPHDEVNELPRRYYYVDGRDHAKLPNLLRTLNDRSDRLVVIVDGAANRLAVDQAMDRVADLILIPFGPSYPDATRAAKHLQRLPDAIGVPNRWPTHPGVRKTADELLRLLPADRLLDAVPALTKVTELLHPDRYQRVSTALSRPGQILALGVLQRLNIHPLDLHRRD
ncbi:cellulose biosynthesis protein BcsQ [Skermanella aerolata]|uniref:hypothetical protein n=1 Tax=Skermanella aerolata TaxID=393310 RepID=UPI003D23E2C1